MIGIKQREYLDSSMAPRFVFPVILENLFTIMIGLITSQVISTISASALAAIGLANQIMYVISAAFSIVTTGSVLLTARQIGAGEKAEAAETIEQSLLLGAASAAIVMVLGLLLSRPLMTLLMPTAEAALYEEAVHYYQMLLVSLICLIPYNILSGVFRALGDSRTPLIAAVSLNIVQVLLAILLIKYIGLEEKGAGLSYVGCRLVGMGILLYAVFFRQKKVRIQWKNAFHPELKTIRRIACLGLPVSIESMFVQTGYLIAGSMSIALGTFRSSVYAVLNTLTTFTALPQSITSVITMTAVGHLLGAGAEKKARKAANIVYAAGTAASFVLVAVLFAGGRFFVSIYSSDAETIQRTVSDFWILIPYTFVCISVNSIEPALRAGGDVRFVMIDTVIAVWLVRLPLTYLFCFVFDWGEIGIYAANTIALGQRSLVPFIRKLGRKWIHQNV